MSKQKVEYRFFHITAMRLGQIVYINLWPSYSYFMIYDGSLYSTEHYNPEDALKHCKKEFKKAPFTDFKINYV